MIQSAHSLRRDAQRIWFSGVEAVLPDKIVPQWLRVEGQKFVVGREETSATGVAIFKLDSIRRIAVVGGGKAGGAMAAAVEAALGSELAAEKQLAGWVNVPADCIREGHAPRRVRLHAARPPGVNEPTPEGEAGSREILRLVESLGPNDLCLCLISGGGSALLPAPAEGISLADKLAVTRFLSAAGANIEQLNTVRKQISRIKGGGLLRACRAGTMISLILSDVLGNPLNLIASGPTVPDSSTPRDAIDVLDRFGVRAAGVAPAVIEYLERKCREANRKIAADTVAPALSGREVGGEASRLADIRMPFGDGRESLPSCRAWNFVIADNATAVAAAAAEAHRLGYAVAARSATASEGLAEEVGRALAERALAARAQGQKTCLIEGGEPVVRLVESSRRGLGGRNQQLVLAALERLTGDGAERIALLSGGTDGEDGPTDAAGAFCDSAVLQDVKRRNLDPASFLARNDAYHFFEPVGALLRTGPTGTNVCDLRVAVVK